MTTKTEHETFPLKLSPDLSVNAYHIGQDFAGRNLFAVPDEDEVQRIYTECQIRFWRDRRSRDYLVTSQVHQIIAQQAMDYMDGTKKAMGEQLVALIDEAMAAGKTEFSILELGCANGPTLRHLRKTRPDVPIRFYGMELTDILVDDLCASFPSATAVTGGADELMTMGVEDFEGGHFDLFLAVGVLCQMPPQVVGALLRHVAGLCDSVLIWDYLLNSDGRASPDDAVFFSLSDTIPHLLFVNPFNQQFTDAGFENMTIMRSPVKDMSQGPGEGAVLARKQGG